MNRTDILISMIELAKVCPTIPPEEAMAVVAAMLDRLDPQAGGYGRDFEAIMNVGVCIWQLQRAAAPASP